MTRVLISGGFDPIHIGHIRLINSASFLGDVIVALNSDSWLISKKGYALMPWQDRAEILLSLTEVKEVHGFSDKDGTVCDALRKIKVDIFANGGDRTQPNPQEEELCRTLGIKQIFGIGGPKIRSSSEIIHMAQQ